MVQVGADKSLGDALAIGLFQGISPGALGTFLYSASFMLLCWFVGYIMDKKKWYVRV
jgi:predicted acyltransferase